MEVPRSNDTLAKLCPAALETARQRVDLAFVEREGGATRAVDLAIIDIRLLRQLDRLARFLKMAAKDRAPRFRNLCARRH